MARSLLRNAIYFIGGAVAFVALIGAVGFAFFASREWTRTQRIRAVVAEDTRTHGRPLNRQRTEENAIEGDATAALAPIQFEDSGRDDVFSFVSMPSFGTWRAVTMSLSTGAALAQGRIISIDQTGYGTPMRFSNEKAFTVPRAEFVRLVLKVDQLTEGWPGDGGDLCYDGEAVAFEHTRQRMALSGSGNADCDRHYAQVQGVVSTFLHRYQNDPEPRIPVR